MPSPQDFINRIGQIVGDDISDGEINLRLSWTNYSDGKALLVRMRGMQKELRLLKKEVGAVIAGIKSEHITARTSVGTGLGTGLFGAFFGRKAAGKMNAARRDDLRRSQISAVAPYERVKEIIDQVLHQLDASKGKVEMSPEYQVRHGPAQTPPPPRLPAPPAPRYFVCISGQVKGPYTLDQLRALRDASAISGDTPCCPEGREEWTDFSSIGG